MIPRRGLLAGLLLLAGCTHPQTRLQSADESDRNSAEVKTIGDITTVTNAEAIPVVGVGLVMGLERTGAPAAAGPDRTALEDYLRKKGVTNIQELFNSDTTALVRVMAFIPAGAHKNDAIDVRVEIPDNSRATSLRGGVLAECLLYNFDSSSRVSAAASAMTGAAMANRPDQLLRGHPLVKAEGAIVAGISTDPDDDEPSLKRGIVWSGGRYQGQDQAFVLELLPDQQYARVAARIADRINETFQGPTTGVGGDGVAKAHSKTYVSLAVSSAYRLNRYRFLQVVRFMPLNEAAGTESAYAQLWAKRLLDPAMTIRAALRLEALGPQSIPALRVGLNSDYQMVRFAAAEALAYLGSPSCGEELGKQVAEHPFVQAFALTALASLNEAICRVKLQELLAAPQPETRYGAFRALQARDERDPLVTGEKLGTFWLHEIARGTLPQIHIATNHRPEVVLFGDQPKLVAPFSFLAGSEFTLVADAGASSCTLKRFSLKGIQTQQCPLEIAAVLRTMDKMGGNYADAVEMLRQAEFFRNLNCALMVNRLPHAPTVRELAIAGSRSQAPGLLPADFGATPTLYERLTGQKSGN